MPQMIPFRYGGFWDVPRHIVTEYRGHVLLLQSEFDDELDDYAANYTVHTLPESVWKSVQEGDWSFYGKTPMSEVGQIPVSSVSFDPSRRKEFDASCIDDLINKYDAARRSGA